MSVCAVALSEHPEPQVAIAEVLGELLGRVGPHPDVAILLVSGRVERSMAEIVATTHALLAPEVLVGAGVPGLFGSSEVRPGADTVLLLAFNTVGGPRPKPIRFGQCSEGRTESDGVALVFGDGALAGCSTVGISSAAAQTLVLDHTQYTDGGVGLVFSPVAVSAVDHRLSDWEESVADPEDPASVQPPEPDFFTVAGGSGLLLFAEESMAGLMAGRFDFEVAFDGFVGSMAGVLGPVGSMITSQTDPGGPNSGRPTDRYVTGLILH